MKSKPIFDAVVSQHVPPPTMLSHRALSRTSHNMVWVHPPRTPEEDARLSQWEGGQTASHRPPFACRNSVGVMPVERWKLLEKCWAWEKPQAYATSVIENPGMANISRARPNRRSWM